MGQFYIPQKTTAVQGIPQGKLDNLDRRLTYLENNPGGGTGFTFLTATGTVDGNNSDFTFTSKPEYIVKDGAWYRENNGWTWSGSTATMSVSPQSDIWGFV